MSDERSWGQYAEDVPDERVLSVFSGVEPYTAREVAAAMNATEHTARAALEALVERDALERETVRGPPARLTVWYRPRTALEGDDADAEADAIDVDARVEELLDDLEFPGTSGMMRSWRRDAVREAFDHLRERGEVTVDQFLAEVFPAHRAGYDDPESWWSMVRPRLRELPGVVDPAWGGETWRYEG